MLNILLIEPDEMRREQLWTALEASGYTTIAAADYAEAEILLTCGKWNVLLTAVDVKGGTGFQLARRATERGIETVFLDANVTTLAAHRARSGRPRSAWLLDLEAHVKTLTEDAEHPLGLPPRAPTRRASPG